MNAEEEKRERIEKEELIEATCLPVEVLAPDSDPVVGTSEIQRQANDREQDKDLEEEYAIDKEKGDDSEWDREIEDGYSDEILRYLVHNTTPHGVRFFLTTIAEFSQSRLGRVMFGEVHLSMLQCIYRHRQYLTSYYRLRRYHPYHEKEMIHSCVLSCPVLPKSFYVFCRQECSSDWNCAKCVSFDRGPSHACFDFFHCGICHERYVASSKHHPYPPLNWRRNYTVQ